MAGPPVRGPRAPPPVDMGAHVGLRGACAIWIMAFHCLLATEYGLDFQASSIMPLFLMLSGFSISVTYGATRWEATTSSCCGRYCGAHAAPPKDDGGEGKAFPAWAFWRNRFARVMPVYLVSLLIAAPTWPLGYGPLPYERTGYIVTVVTSVIPVSSFACFINVNGPGWFVSTLACIWLVFPCLLPRVQQMSDASLVRWIVRCFHIQWFVLIAVFWALLPTVGYGVAFLLATMHPVSRLPVFLMGMYAGELALRYPHKTDAATETHGHAGGSSYLPWPRAFMGFWPIQPPGQAPQPAAAVAPGEAAAAALEGGPVHADLPTVPASSPPPPPPPCCGRLGQPPPRTQSAWASMATTQSLGLLIATLLVSAAQVAVTLTLGPGATIFGNIYLQAMVPMAQLNVLVALTRDGGGSSLASRALRTPFAQWLGKLSMNIYLIHYPLIAYLGFLLNGAKPNVYSCGPEEAEADCSARYELNKNIPLWGILAVAAVTLALAELAHRAIELPARRCLRKEG